MSTLDAAQAKLDAGDYAGAREAALAALATSADDVELLRIAGRAGVELGADDAVDQLRRVTELRGDDASGWRELGDALATEGRDAEANEAFRRAVDLDPTDETSLTALGHTAYQAGQREDAVTYLERAAAGAARGASTAAISLVEMYRVLGQPEAALEAALKVAEAEPESTLAALDVAELSLQVGRLDVAAEAFQRVRAVDPIGDHEVYALHGLVQVALAGDDAARALELAREAQALDRYGRTAVVLAFLDPSDDAGEPPTRDEVNAALAASIAEHRRSHAEDALA